MPLSRKLLNNLREQYPDKNLEERKRIAYAIESKRKGKGWHGESGRHSKARKS